MRWREANCDQSSLLVLAKSHLSPRDHTNICSSCLGKGSQRWLRGQIIEVFCFCWRDHRKIILCKYLQDCANSRTEVFSIIIWDLFLCFTRYLVLFAVCVSFVGLSLYSELNQHPFCNILLWAVIMTIKTVFLSEDRETRGGHLRKETRREQIKRQGGFSWCLKLFLLQLLSHQSLSIHEPPPQELRFWAPT